MRKGVRFGSTLKALVFVEYVLLVFLVTIEQIHLINSIKFNETEYPILERWELEPQ